MSTTTGYSSPFILFTRCRCCVEAGCGTSEMPLGMKQVVCPECGENCSCPGCYADVDA